ncbi:cytochrome P460 family protein [Pedobacter hartonius]|uniref:Cytochrome P460 n=1 Tax=Pedobacter hartonius TaxID=425514 RepID=A0A1H4GZ06_9SPHI|nr:cytochrome P460 family protein [Pedobacter hartonius]SEB14807.1 Cytochrome P460 [Pedobacter hartonius]
MKAIYILFPVLVLLAAACREQPDEKQLINKEASLPEDFNFSKLGLKVLSSSVNEKQNTMSTIYGNDLALNTAKAGTPVQAGEVLAMITWKQKKDEHWFGAKIPGNLQTVEMIRTSPDAQKSAKVDYQRYEGKKLTLKQDTTGNDKNIRYIFEQHPSVMP